MRFDFPNIDLFQSVHFHYGALQYAKFGILNPLIADSYVPFRQIIMGLVALFGGVHPLTFVWVYPYINVIFWLVAAVMFRQSILNFTEIQNQDLKTRNIYYGFMTGLFLVCMMGFQFPTNGSLSSFFALILLCCLIRVLSQTNLKIDNSYQTSEKVVVCLVAILAALVFGLLSKRVDVFLFSAIIVGLSAICLRVKNTENIQLFVCIFWLAFLVAFLHRGGFLALGIISGCLIALNILNSKAVVGKIGKIGPIILGLGVLLLISLVGYILVVGEQDDPDVFGLFPVFNIFSENLIGRVISIDKIDGDLSSGLGARIGLFELARSPVTYLAALIPCVCIVLIKSRYRGPAERQAKYGRISTFALSTAVVATLFAVFALSGFPFVHRFGWILSVLLLFFIASIFALISKEMFFRGFSDFIILISAYAFNSAIIGFVFSEFANRNYIDYLQYFLPVFFLLATSLILFLLLAKRRSEFRILSILSITIFNFYIQDMFFLSQKFQNEAPPQSGVLSHMQSHHFELDNILSSSNRLTHFVFSDPAMNSFVMANYGITPLYSHSNLRTVNADTSKNARMLQATLLTVSYDEEACSLLSNFGSIFSSGAKNYLTLRERYSGVETLKVLKLGNYLLPGLYKPKDWKVVSLVDVNMDYNVPLTSADYNVPLTSAKVNKSKQFLNKKQKLTSSQPNFFSEVPKDKFIITNVVSQNTWDWAFKGVEIPYFSAAEPLEFADRDDLTLSDWEPISDWALIRHFVCEPF